MNFSAHQSLSLLVPFGGRALFTSRLSCLLEGKDLLFDGNNIKAEALEVHKKFLVYAHLIKIYCLLASMLFGC